MQHSIQLSPGICLASICSGPGCQSYSQPSAFSSSLLQPLQSTKMRVPHSGKSSKLGFDLCSISNGVFLLRAHVNVQFFNHVTCCTDSAHMNLSRSAASSIMHVCLSKEWLRHSDMPFSSGVMYSEAAYSSVILEM